MPTEYSQWPYGYYESRTSITFFNRRYEPIVRLDYDDHPIFAHGEPTGSLRSGAQRVNVVNPKTRIIFSGQRWFYNDANPPRRDKQTRQRLEALMAQIPALGTEVNMRSERKKVAA